MQEQVNWRGMPFYDALFHKRYFTLREMRDAFCNYYAIVFWAMVTFVLVLLDFHGFAARVSISASFVYAISLIVLTLVFYAAFCLIGLWLSQHSQKFFAIMPAIGFFAIILATYGVELGMSSIYGTGPSLTHAVEKLPKNIVLTLTLETLYITFVFPLAARSRKGSHGAFSGSGVDDADPGRILYLAGIPIDSGALVLVAAQDHYVLVKTRSEDHLVRARLSDIVAQLNGLNGIQPHRSFWVAKEAVSDLVAIDGQKQLVLADESKVPVARARLADVRAWLEK